MANPKLEKFDFEKMKAAAASDNPVIRKRVFFEYFERFGEFPSYLFENEGKIDSRLQRTIDDLRKDPGITKEMQKGDRSITEQTPCLI